MKVLVLPVIFIANGNHRYFHVILQLFQLSKNICVHCYSEITGDYYTCY